MRLAVILSALVLGACASDSPAARPAPTEATVATHDQDFTDDQGRLICPVMGDVIESKAQAVGQTDHDGKTYWFCCDSCQHMFEDDPERYADGRFLAHLQEAHDGRFTPCFHVL